MASVYFVSVAIVAALLWFTNDCPKVRSNGQTSIPTLNKSVLEFRNLLHQIIKEELHKKKHRMKKRTRDSKLNDSLKNKNLSEQGKKASQSIIN